MSQKAKCPACESYTSAIYAAEREREPCPYCGADLVTGVVPLGKIAWLRGDGDVTYRFDLAPIDFDEETRAWEKLRDEGGNVLNSSGDVIGHVAPAVHDQDDPFKWVATITFNPEQS